MKELSIEQKAIAYDEAIERAKELLGIGLKDTRDKRVVLSFFPELKESEDERIRKELLDFCKNRAEYYSNDPKYKNISAWIAWLEKQSEQKPAWSEEDNKWIESLIQTFEDGYFEGFNQLKSYGVIDWLKSLKERNTWKPSDKQIIALRWVLNNIPYNKHKEEISGLLDQIKDL